MKAPTENPTDPLGSLGKPIKPTAAPAPEWRSVAPGIERNSSGQVRTTAPAPVPIVWIPTPRDEEND